jgi:hypothetical protein
VKPIVECGCSTPIDGGIYVHISEDGRTLIRGASMVIQSEVRFNGGARLVTAWCC